MNFHVLTLFPEMIEQALGTSITGRAMKAGTLTLNTVNIRDFALESRKGRVDDYSYGGGAGMIMQAEPVYSAYRHVIDRIADQREEAGKQRKIRVICLSPAGQTFSQKMAQELSAEDDLVFLCGHYEGIDQRVLDEIVTDEVSVGDYVLTGGELPALVMMDAIARLVPGVLNNEESAQTESFMGDGLLEYPQYSRPEVWHGKEVPGVLLSGNHQAVDRWRRDRSLERTAVRRPDLCGKAVLSKKDREYLKEEDLLDFYDQKRPPVRNLIFDAGYVLLGYTWREDFKRFGYDEEGVELLAQKIFGPPQSEEERTDIWHQYDMGLVSDEEVRDCLEKQYPEDTEALEWFFGDQGRWVKSLEDITGQMEQLRRKGYHIYILSNYPCTTFHVHLARMEWKKYLDGALVSYETHFGKPEQRFYRLLLERYGMKAEECVFFDDRKENTLAAEKLGIRSFTLDTPKNRRKAVSFLSMLPQA